MLSVTLSFYKHPRSVPCAQDWANPELWGKIQTGPEEQAAAGGWGSVRGRQCQVPSPNSQATVKAALHPEGRESALNHGGSTLPLLVGLWHSG